MKAILNACGFDKTYEARTKQEIVENIQKMKKEGKSAMILYTKQGSRDDLGRPTTTPIENKNSFMKEIKK